MLIEAIKNNKYVKVGLSMFFYTVCFTYPTGKTVRLYLVVKVY